MSTRMTEADWAHTLEVFRACLPRRGRKAADDRLFLEAAWEALESAGHVPDHFQGLIGVYAGAHNNTYYANIVAQRPDVIGRLGQFPTMLANEKDYLATRTAYALNLNGPAISLHTACSTSLVAVVQAVHSLLAHQCDLALVLTICYLGFIYKQDATAV